MELSEKIFTIDVHVGATGLGDILQLIDETQLAAQTHRLTYESPVDISSLAKHLVHICTTIRDYNPVLDGESGEKLLNLTAPKMVDISDNQYNPHVTKVTQIKETLEEPNQSQSRPSNSANQIRPTEEDLELNIDWDKDHQSRFVRWVFQEKKQRNVERGMIRAHWKSIAQSREKLEKEKKDFALAEDDLAQQIRNVRDLLPVAAEFKQAGLDFSLANSWLVCVKELAARKGLDLRTAAWKLVDDLKNFEYLGGFETSIQNAKHQLELLDYAIQEKKQVIATLVDLRNKGIYEREIAQVVETIKSKMSTHQHSSTRTIYHNDSGKM